MRAPQFDSKIGRLQDRISATTEFRTLPKGKIEIFAIFVKK